MKTKMPTWIAFLFLFGGNLFIFRGTLTACQENPPKPTISVTGAISTSSTNTYIVQQPKTGNTAVTVSVSGQTPCPTDQEKCKCDNQKKDPATDGDPIYTISHTVGTQTPTNGPTINWSVTSSTAPGEYKFKVTKIEQKYKACDAGWTGGVASKSNSQASDEIIVYVVKVNILGSNTTVESQTSGEFEAQVLPASLTPTTYSWLSGAPDAWPNGAGNSPALNYSASTASKTKVNTTRWFAPTNNRRQLVDGTTCQYNINCDVTVLGVTLRSLTPGTLTVTVNMTGQTVRPTFQNWNTITVANVGGTWTVTGQGSFSRTTPAASVNLPSTSQFYAKAMVHENKHVAQWTSEAPWKDLFDANALYNSTLKNLTSTVSEADLRAQIDAAVVAKRTADTNTANSTVCAREKGAFDAMNAVAPDFLELDDADWKPLYGCP